MKKILSILICAVLVTSFASSPLKASANTAQNEQLISLLMQMVTMLQAQLAVLLGQSHQTNAVIPVIYSVTPSTASIGSTIDISGYFYNRSANCQTNGCIMAQHSEVSIKNSVGQSQVLLSGTLNGGDKEIIKLTIPSSKPCVATPKGDCFPGAYVITPGQYLLTVTTDGVVSNSVPLTISSGLISPITVISPNGGGSFKAGSMQTIKWTGGQNGVELMLETYEEGELVVAGWIAHNVDSSLGQYEWKIGDLISDDGVTKFKVPSGKSGKYFVRISDFKTGNLDRSDELFTITN